MVAEKNPPLADSAFSPVVPELRPNPAADLTDLTPAERAVLELVCAGCSNKEIAAALGKAEPTIKHQLRSAMLKLGVQSRCQMIVLLLRGPESLRR